MKKLKYVLVAGLALFSLISISCKTDASGNNENSNQTEENQKGGDDSSQSGESSSQKGSEESGSGESSKTVTAGFVLVPAASIAGTDNWSPTSNVFVSGRKLEIASFYMCDHEVTQSEFNTVMGTNPSLATTDGTADNNPVNYVDWYHAIAYCNKLSAKEGLDPCYTVTGITNWSSLAYSSIPTSSNSTWNAASFNTKANGYRLPTEVEWEWAARGGQISGTTYAGSNTIDDVAWYTSNSSDKTHEVKTKAANAYALYDMSGNVFEWCWDWYGSVNSSTGATGASSGMYRVRRGSSGFPYDQAKFSGFRVVRSVQ